MFRMTIAVLMALFFYPLSAKAQDALGTFMYLFLDENIDVTHKYGDQFVVEHAYSGDARIEGRKTISLQKSCSFEVKIDGINNGPMGGPHVVKIQRWDFNKAFFDEIKAKQFLDGSVEITIPGEKGLTYWSEVCLSDAHSCEWGSGYRGETTYDKEILRVSDQVERRLKALKYFVQNFCPGTKRKSAF